MGMPCCTLHHGIRLCHSAQPCPADRNGIGGSWKRRADAAVGACLAVGHGIHANRMGISIHGHSPFDGTHTGLQAEVRLELRERPRYWRRAVAVYWAAIVAVVNVVFLLFCRQISVACREMCKCAAQIFSHTRARKIIRWKSHNCGVDVPDKQSLCWLEVSWPSFRSPICRHAMHILSFLPASELSRYSGSDRVSFFLPPV